MQPDWRANALSFSSCTIFASPSHGTAAAIALRMTMMAASTSSTLFSTACAISHDLSLALSKAVTCPLSSTSTLSTFAKDSTNTGSSLGSHVLGLLTTTKGAARSEAKAFSVVSAVKDEDIDTEPADVFVPFPANQVAPTLPPVIQNPTMCTFPELFRRNTRQRAPRNARAFRRYRQDTIVRFSLRYTVRNGVASVLLSSSLLIVVVVVVAVVVAGGAPTDSVRTE